MKVVSREEVIEKLGVNIDGIVENIIASFNERSDPDHFYVDKKLYNKLNGSTLRLVISKLNEILKEYNYVVSCDQSFWIKYVE